MTSDDRRPDQSWSAVPEAAPDEAPLPPPGPADPLPAAPEPARPSRQRAPEPGLPPPAPGGVYAAVPSAPGAVTAPPSPTNRRNGIIAAIAGGIVLVGALLLKFGLPILLGTAVSGVLGGVFGGPFEKLPQDQQQVLEQRFEAAVGDTLDGLSEAESATRIDAMMTAGMPRLGDELLVEKVHLTARLLNGADEASCAGIARATAAGVVDEEGMSAALQAMDTPSVGRWFEINVSAMEAEAAGTPVRAVDTAEANRVLGDVIGAFSETEGQQIADLYDGGEVADADACNAMRALYRHIEELSGADLSIAALYDVTP